MTANSATKEVNALSKKASRDAMRRVQEEADARRKEAVAIDLRCGQSWMTQGVGRGMLHYQLRPLPSIWCLARP